VSQVNAKQFAPNGFPSAIYGRYARCGRSASGSVVHPPAPAIHRNAHPGGGERPGEGGVSALEEALARFGRPEIFNTDQGSQFTREA
jgi:hypothetical protein